MKVLALSNKHKLLLLEMINTLVKDNAKGSTHIENTGLIYLYVSGDGVHYKYVLSDIIHWFEFCTTHLFDKIFRTTQSKYIEQARTEMFAGIEAIVHGGENEDQIHPVDFLYKHFKSL